MLELPLDVVVLDEDVPIGVALTLAELHIPPPEGHKFPTTESSAKGGQEKRMVVRAEFLGRYEKKFRLFPGEGSCLSLRFLAFGKLAQLGRWIRVHYFVLDGMIHNHPERAHD